MCPGIPGHTKYDRKEVVLLSKRDKSWFRKLAQNNPAKHRELSRKGGLASAAKKKAAKEKKLRQEEVEQIQQDLWYRRGPGDLPKSRRPTSTIRDMTNYDPNASWVKDGLEWF